MCACGQHFCTVASVSPRAGHCLLSLFVLPFAATPLHSCSLHFLKHESLSSHANVCSKFGVLCRCALCLNSSYNSMQEFSKCNKCYSAVSLVTELEGYVDTRPSPTTVSGTMKTACSIQLCSLQKVAVAES